MDSSGGKVGEVSGWSDFWGLDDLIFLDLDGQILGFGPSPSGLNPKP